MRSRRRPGRLALLAVLACALFDSARSGALAQDGGTGDAGTGDVPVAPAEASPGEPATTPPASDEPASGEAATSEPATSEPATSEPAATPPPSGPLRRVIVVDAATYGIDPVVGRVVTERMRRAAAALGYEVLPADATVQAALRLRMPYPPAPADLWRVSWVAQVHRGAFARVWASEGRYVIEMMVASLDGTGPFFARETAGSDDLREVIDRMVSATLPAPSQWQATSTSLPDQTAAPATRRWRERPREELAHPGGIGVRLPEPPLRRLQLTLQTEGAIGTTQGGFYNHLVGARFDVRVTRDLMFGVYFGYTNLQGRNDRASNILMMIQGEQRIRVSPSIPLSIPLRVAAGYLPFNGPVIRLSAGVNYAISDDFEIGADIIAPTFWILPEDVAVSLNIAIEGTYRFEI